MEYGGIGLGYDPIRWCGESLRLIDQTRLPRKEVYLELRDYRAVARAIETLKIRGAPAIGIAGAYAVALAARKIKARSTAEFRRKLSRVFDRIAGTRPTARNLFFALERLKKAAVSGKDITTIRQALLEEALKIHGEEMEASRRIGELGSALFPQGAVILTHCNTGPLATGGYGTALGVIITAHRKGRDIRVIATETRPLLQGARLTTWELMKAGVPVSLVTDSMAGYLMKQGKIKCVIVGADRIAANGDTANKIGTYPLAVLARENRIPFYVAAPTSTFDFSLKSGDEIPIEERSPLEVTTLAGKPIAPPDIPALNPAFDITPHRYISAIITERGIITGPSARSVRSLLGKNPR
ncbi:MAG: S-methyl-5-thioribose-1-phosphate isomerase [Dehalococcoidales bacterium]|nr:S-methyl-5-thioribose-1-phosphate isomerase [Dehalococcoidales bacterium]